MIRTMIMTPKSKIDFTIPLFYPSIFYAKNACLTVVEDKILEISVIGELDLRGPPEGEVVVDLSVDEPLVSFLDAGEESLPAPKRLLVRRNVSLDLRLVQNVTQRSERFGDVHVPVS